MKAYVAQRRINDSRTLKKAWRVLIQDGINPKSLKTWLKILSPTSKDLVWRTKRDRHDAELLARKAKKLAAEIEQAMLADFKLIKNAASFTPLINTLPGLLRVYAEVWPETFLKPSDFGPTERLNLVCIFLTFVRNETKRPHYRVVADLLNTLDQAHTIPLRHENAPRWTEENLRQLAYRKRKLQRPPALQGTKR